MEDKSTGMGNLSAEMLARTTDEFEKDFRDLMKTFKQFNTKEYFIDAVRNSKYSEKELKELGTDMDEIVAYIDANWDAL